MRKVLVTYATNSGSTGEVAEAIKVELIHNGLDAEVKCIDEVISVNSYDAVVVGAPMILGWHPDARRFLKRFRNDLTNKKVAYFACAMRLTQVSREELPDVSLTLDPSLISQPEKMGKMNIKERFTSIGYYLKPMLKSASMIKPINIAFLNGKLEMFRLKWWQAAFVMIVVQGVPGDCRDWDFIKSWSRSISAMI